MPGVWRCSLVVILRRRHAANLSILPVGLGCLAHMPLDATSSFHGRLLLLLLDAARRRHTCLLAALLTRTMSRQKYNSSAISLAAKDRAAAPSQARSKRIRRKRTTRRRWHGSTTGSSKATPHSLKFFILVEFRSKVVIYE
jgi:hypothetical protein